MDVDKRVRKSKDAIRQAMIDLLMEKELDEITVSELSERAGVNRKTFYNHYDNLMALIEEMNQDTIETYEREMAGISIKTAFRDPFQVFTRLNAFFTGDNFYSKLLQSDKNGTLVKRLTFSLREQIMRTDQGIPKDKQEMLIRLYVPGLVSIYREWLMNGKKENLEEIARSLAVVIFKGLDVYLGK